jgi:DNA-binding GntR family transcriptional regulator
MPNDIPPLLLEPQRTRAAKSLADSVLAWLVDQLVSGTLRPGQWISETDVAAELGVSRSPVREALRDLAKEGLVEVHPRRATIVAQLSEQDAADLYWARQLISAEMARLAVEQMTDAHIDELTAILEDMRRSIGDPRACYQCTRRWAQLQMDCCPSRSIRDIDAMLWRRSIRFQGILLRMPEQQHDVVTYAEQFIQAARRRDAQAAQTLHAELLGRARQRLLENVFLQTEERGAFERPLAQSAPTR